MVSCWNNNNFNVLHFTKLNKFLKCDICILIFLLRLRLSRIIFSDPGVVTDDYSGPEVLPLCSYSESKLQSKVWCGYSPLLVI